MATVSQRELRNDSGRVMDRVESGETITLTRRGRAIAEIVPIRGPRTWVSREDILRAFQGLPPVHGDLKADADEFWGDGGDRVA
jgi:prevent-host-death family protein